MPRTRDCIWDGFSAGLRPQGKIRGLLLRLGRSYILPYLYLSKVDLDLEIHFPLSINPKEVIGYEWDLSCEHMDKIENDPEVNTHGQGLIEVGNIVSTYQKANFWDRLKLARKFEDQGILTDIETPTVMTKSGTMYQRGAVSLGWLSFPDRYKVRMKFTDNSGAVVGKYGTRILFTMRDADEFHISVILIMYTLIGTVVGGAIGAIVTYVVKGG
jgi:hypothetical protein